MTAGAAGSEPGLTSLLASADLVTLQGALLAAQDGIPVPFLLQGLVSAPTLTQVN